MPLNDCRCCLCRQYLDLADVSKMLEEASAPLPPDQQAILEQIVKDAWARLQLPQSEGSNP